MVKEKVKRHKCAHALTAYTGEKRGCVFVCARVWDGSYDGGRERDAAAESSGHWLDWHRHAVQAWVPNKLQG